MTIEPYELEIIKALGVRGPLHPMQLMPLAYPFGIREGGRAAEEQRLGKKADYIHTVLSGLLVKDFIFMNKEDKVELTSSGWEIYKANRG